MISLRKNNKGVSNDVQIAILAVTALLIFSFFLYHEYTVLRDKMALQSCKNSIQAHSLVATATSKGILTDIKCPTSEITIRDLKKAKPTIAEDMHRCWYIWDQGKGRYFQGSETFCYICSIYQFGDKKQTINGFGQYLSSTHIQVRYPGDVEGTKYTEYFQGYTGPNSIEAINLQLDSLIIDDSLNTSLKYATIFVYASGKDAIQKYNIADPTATIKDIEYVSFIAFRQYNSIELKNLDCAEMVVNQMSNAGDRLTSTDK